MIGAIILQVILIALNAVFTCAETAIVSLNDNQLEEMANQFKGVDKSFAIQAGREIRVMVVPDQVTDDDMVLMAREIANQIEFELEYPGQIKVNVIRESRVTDYAK